MQTVAPFTPADVATRTCGNCRKQMMRVRWEGPLLAYLCPNCHRRDHVDCPNPPPSFQE